jgi:hypothetical protein
MTLPGQVVAYGRAVEMLTQGYVNYALGQVTVSLHTSAYVPNVSDSNFGDIRGEVVGGGYTRRKLQGREVIFDTAVQRFQLVATRVVFPLVTLTARWAVLHFEASPAADLLAWVDLGGSRQVFNATLAIGWENDMIMEIEGVDG